MVTGQGAQRVRPHGSLLGLGLRLNLKLAQGLKNDLLDEGLLFSPRRSVVEVGA